MIDGAHAPGMLPLDLGRLGADFVTGNLHKWVCAPKGAGFLWASEPRRDALRPLVVSHGANSTRTDRSRFHLEFDYVGTDDLSAYLSVPDALDAVASLEPGGWPEVMAKNHALALAAGEVLTRTLGLAAGAPPELRGCMFAVELPPGDGTTARRDGPAPPRAVRRAPHRGAGVRLARAAAAYPPHLGSAVQPAGATTRSSPVPSPPAASFSRGEKGRDTFAV